MLIVDENRKLRKELEQAINTSNDKQFYEKIEEELCLLKQEYSKITDQYKDLIKVDEKEYSIQDMLDLRSDIENFWNTNSTKAIQNDLMAIKIYSWINRITLNCEQIKQMSSSLCDVMKDCKELRENLQQSRNKIAELTIDIDRLNNSKILWDGEKKKMETDYIVLQKELIENNKELDCLKKEMEKNEIELMKKNKELLDIKDKIINNEDKSTTKTIQDASSSLEEVKKELVMCQEEIYRKSEIILNNDLKTAELEADLKNVNKNLELSQKEVQKLQNAIDEIMEQKGTSQADSCKYSAQAEIEEKHLLKAELLKAEVSIREDLQKEYLRKINKIEDSYKSILTVNQQKLNKYKEQENTYRHQLADVLSRYAQLISSIQKENETLKEHLSKFESYCNALSIQLETTKKEYDIKIEKTKSEAQKSIDEWKIWAKTLVQGCLNIEKLNAQTRSQIVNSFQQSEDQVESIDKYFEEKIRQYKRKNKLTKP
ncbi:hypothetical protein WA026_008422 [Henosepilachna vigintioctopunctata]|uniref:Uncharacterized protein n=1 Tax=Henosepilachna vigintioctopunctata TaxID=420089 RepID=A0AAW1UHG1_9CUCU